MAGFRTHVTTSTVFGVGYAGVGYFMYGMPPDTAVVAGAICGFSGMLPDIDSDYGVPLRETMGFTAAILPMLLLGHFQSFEMSHDSMVLAAISVYLFVRFGVTKIIRRCTVHRGMFHSIPACLIFSGLAFLLCATAPTVEIRFYKAGGVALGFMSHLLLDEIYSVEWQGGRWRFKKSFGTAIKFWGRDTWANFSTYGKLLVVAALILGEPMVMEQLEAHHPGFAGRVDRFRNRLGEIKTTAKAHSAFDAARNAFAPLANAGNGGGLDSQTPANTPMQSSVPVTPIDPFQLSVPQSPLTHPGFPNEVGTAQRSSDYYPQ